MFVFVNLLIQSFIVKAFGFLVSMSQALLSETTLLCVLYRWLNS